MLDHAGLDDACVDGVAARDGAAVRMLNDLGFGAAGDQRRYADQTAL
jgi:hypothetical protein